MAGERHRSDVRGQSPVVGFALLVGLVVLGTVAVLVFGGAALSELQGAAETERAEVAMTQLDASAARVALGGSNGQRIDVPSGAEGRMDVRPNAGSMTIKVDPLSGPSTTILADQDLGAVVYRTGDSIIAYQGGGVWRRPNTDSDASRMVSPPEFHFRGSTLTLPVISIAGDADTDGAALRVKPNGLFQSVFPNEAVGLTNPVTSGTVTVNVTSDYYRAWGEYFEERTEGSATYYPEQDRVSIALISPVTRPPIANAVTGTSGAGELVLAGNGATTDSYDSRDGPYGAAIHPNSGGTVSVAGDVYMKGTSRIEGDVSAGQSIEMCGTPDINGDAFYTTSFSAGGAASVSGTTKQISGVGGVDDIDPLVDSRVASLQTSGTGLGSFVVTGSQTITSGSYYASHVTVNGGTLTIDTSGGDVNVAVKNWFKVTNSGTVEIVGDGRVNVWLKGETETIENYPGTAGGNPCGGGGGSNQEPTADAGSSYTVDEGDTVTLDGSGSSDPEDNDNQLDYEWDINGNSYGASITGGNQETATFDAPANVNSDRTVDVTLTVTDTQGSSTTDSTTVTIENTGTGNADPTAEAGGGGDSRYDVDEGGNTITLSGSGSDSDGSVVSYSWTITSTGTTGTFTSGKNSASPTYESPDDVNGDQTITVELEVTDDDGAIDTDTATIKIKDTDGGPPCGSPPCGGGPPLIGVADRAYSVAGVNATTLVRRLSLGSQAVDFYVGKDSKIVTDDGDDNASQFFVYGTSDTKSVVAGPGAEMVGVIYAPAGDSGSSSFYTKQGEVYGGVVAGTVEAGQFGEVHYDEALADTRTIPKNAAAITLTYLHVSLNEITVEEG